MAHHSPPMSALCTLLLSFPAFVPPQQPAPVDERAKRRFTPEVQVVQEASPAVVYIVSIGYSVAYDIFNQPHRQESRAAGTGVMVDADGFLVTNFHVVANAAGQEGGKLQIQFDSAVDAKTYDAQLVSYVEREDLALLKIAGNRKFPTVNLGTSADLMIGERVIAIGNPFQQKLSVSAGIISGLHRELAVTGSRLAFNDLIQTDASINHGNSGGPLLNINGELIGINTVVREGAENMGYAIPVDRVRDVLLNQLFAPTWEKAWLGFELEAAPSLSVASVRSGSPAADAGIAVGDKILALDGFALADLAPDATGADGKTPKTPRDEYNNRRLTLLPGVDVKLRLKHGTGERELALRGWRKIDGILYDRLGLTTEVVAVWPGTMLCIDKIAPDGPAAAIGLQKGDIIDAVRKESEKRAWSLSQPDALAKLVVDLAAKSVLEIDILRDEDHDRRLEENELFKGRLILR